jgi:membrane protease YdiL (CAAX protease family)
VPADRSEKGPVPDLLPACRDAIRVRWAGSLVVGFFVYSLKVGVVIGVPVGIWAAAHGMRPDELREQLTGPTPLAFTVMALCELLLCCIALFASTGFWPRPVGLRWQGAGRSIVLLAPLMALLAYLVAADPTVSVRAALESELLPLVIVLCLLIGLTEELVFRGLLVGILGGSRLPVFAALVSGALFGLVHVVALDANSALIAWSIFGLFGVPFALVYLRTGSILGIALLHAGWDTVIIASRGIEQPANQAAAVDPSALALPGIVAVAYVTWFWFTQPVRAAIPNPVRARRERSRVDWDALADDDFVHPWVAAQLRGAAVARE